MAYNLKWRKCTAPYDSVPVVPITNRLWYNARIRGTQFQIKSFQGGWFALCITGSDLAPQIGIGVADDPTFDNCYRIVEPNCLQLRNVDTGNWFTLVQVGSPSAVGFSSSVIPDSFQSNSTVTNPPTLEILNFDTSEYCAPWILDDELSGISLAFVCEVAPVQIYRADTTLITADNTLMTADYYY